MDAKSVLGEFLQSIGKKLTIEEMVHLERLIDNYVTTEKIKQEKMRSVGES